MSAVCLIDTSIFVEILNVPQKANNNQQILDELKEKIENNEKLFLPLATILETGNHIARIQNGNQRRQYAKLFVNEVQKALNGESPFQPIQFIQREEMQQWLNEFPESAMQGHSLGDLSIINNYKRISERHKGMKVNIWSLDEHLSAYSYTPSI